jgi:ribosomal protein L7/L12
MNRNEFKNMLPDVEEIEQAAKDKNLNELSPVFVRGAMWALLDCLLPKFPDLTEDEKFAIELYNKDKLQALKYLMHETGRGLKEANDFLQQNQNQ